MKNFSVKTADFDSLSISGEAPIVQSDLGTAPNQIPLNKDLGSLAYMNAPQIEDLNVDTLELREIAAELSDTAVDVFVYDTRKDSDGGAWRSRTSHTSWYNEELNTATRGGRREFPAVAVIVAETNKVTIYDGDDPDLNMWMVFENLGTFSFVRNNLSSVFALNGQLCIGIGNAGGLSIARFANDSGYTYFTSERRTWSSVIATRTELVYDGANDTSIVIVNNSINDVAMTVLPNAPIDDNTGLPIPTIAVATDGGVSVIRDDGSVTNSSFIDKSRKVNFYNSYLFVVRDDANILIAQNVNELRNLESGLRTFNGDYFYYRKDASQSSSFPWLLEDGSGLVRPIEFGNFGSYLGLTKIDSNLSSDGMGAWIASSYNTGWMPGDIKLAALSDTKIETVGVDETELVTNGTFNSDTTGWDSGSYGASINISHDASQQAKVEVVSGNAIFIHQQLSGLKVGKKYTFSAVVTPQVGASIPWWLYFGNTMIPEFEVGYNSLTNGTQNIFSIDFIATSETQDVGFGQSSPGITTGEYILIDNISVKQTGELITNGTFDNGTEGWGTGADSTFDPSTGQAVVGGTYSGGGYIYQTGINFIEGKTYTVSVEVVSFTGDYGRFYVGSSSNGFVATTTGYHSFTFVYSSSLGDVTPLYLQAYPSGETATFDNISVRLAEPDRSVNDNGLQIFGEITKSPVAPGADLVAYSGFSAENYLMQPYNSDLDFGTGDFCVMGWAKTTSTANQKIFTRDLNLTNRFQVYINNGGVSVFTEEDDQFSYLEGSTDVNNGSWFNFFCIRRSDVLEVYVNGKQETAQASGNHETARNLNFGQIASYAGIHIHNSANYFEGSIALFRISATAPTPEQIAKIYRDEKPLFQDGAQATLYGTSDAVTALAYDDSENLLHVGTASGRSSFNGLKRVDNTTTAVSTAISATEGLVIEQ
jgi:hypothetical protein